MARQPSFWYVTTREGCFEGKHQIQDVFSIESKDKNVHCTSCRVRGHKSKLSDRHSELWGVKGKKTKNVQACSLFSLSSLFSEKGVGNSSFFLPFHYNTSPELDEIPLKGNALGGEYTKCLRGTKRHVVLISTMDSMAAAGSYRCIRERQWKAEVIYQCYRIRSKSQRASLAVSRLTSCSQRQNLSIKPRT